MSQENVEIVRRAFDAYQRGDLAEMLADVDPELVTHRAPPQPDAGTWHGPQGFLQAFAGWIEGFDDWTMTVEEFIDANDTQVVVRVHQRAVGSESRVPIEGDFWIVHTLRDGKGVRVEFHSEEAGALEAAGLSE